MSGSKENGVQGQVHLFPVSKKNTILKGLWVWLVSGKGGGQIAEEFTGGNLGKCPGIGEAHAGAKIQAF